MTQPPEEAHAFLPTSNAAAFAQFLRFQNPPIVRNRLFQRASFPFAWGETVRRAVHRLHSNVLVSRQRTWERVNQATSRDGLHFRLSADSLVFSSTNHTGDN